MFSDQKVVNQMSAVFQRDWSSAAPAEAQPLTILDAPAKKVAKVVARHINVLLYRGKLSPAQIPQLA